MESNNINNNFKNFFIKHNTFFKTLLFFLYIMIVLMIISFLLSCFGNNILNFLNIKNEGTSILILELILYLIGLYLPVMIYKIIFKYNFNIHFKFNKIYFKNLIISILLGFFLQPIGMGISYFSTYLIGLNTTSNFMSNFDSSTNIFALLFIMAIIPPIIEEVIFRDIIFTKLKNRYNIYFSAIICGLLFGIFHTDLQQFFYAAFLGFIFALIVNRTGNILDTIIIHLTINSVQVFLSYVTLKEYGSEVFNQEVNLTFASSFSYLIVSLIIFIPICYFIYRFYKNVNTINK